MRRIALLFVFTLLYSFKSVAQCSMCKAVAESNLESGGGMAAGLNSGILYLMAIPYLLIGFIAFLWYRHSKSHSTN